MKIMVLSSHAPSLFTFREDMMLEMSRNGHEVVAAAPEPEVNWQGEFKKHGVQYMSIHGVERTGTNPVRDLIGFMSIYQAIKVARPDKVFAYHAKTIIYGCLASKMAGMDQIYAMMGGLGSVLRDQRRVSIVRGIMKLQYKIAFRCCAAVFVQNQDDHKALVEGQLIGATRVVLTNGSGVNLDNFTEKELPKTPRFLMIARLIRDKGVLEYIQAAQIVKKLYPEVGFQLVGNFDTNPTAISELEIKRQLADGTIEYMGSTDDVRPFIEQCSVFVLPSYHEGTPKSVLEAMAMGRPIITTDAPGCRETVVEGVNGFLIPPKDASSLAEKMVWMIQHMEEARRMGMESRRICEYKFDVRLVNDVILRAMGLKPGEPEGVCTH